jgi:hypothetical protein
LLLSDSSLLILPFEFWKHVVVGRKYLWTRHCVSASLFNSSPIFLIISFAGGRRMNMYLVGAAAAMHRHQNTYCAVGEFATMDNAQQHSIVQFHRRLYPSGSSIVIQVWGNNVAVHTTISIRLLPAAIKLSECPHAVRQTGDCSIHK